MKMSKPTQQQLAAALLAKTRAGEPDKEYLSRQTDTAHEGPVTSLNPDAPVEGAFNAEGHRPVLERSRKVR